MQDTPAGSLPGCFARFRRQWGYRARPAIPAQSGCRAGRGPSQRAKAHPARPVQPVGYPAAPADPRVELAGRPVVEWPARGPGRRPPFRPPRVGPPGHLRRQQPRGRRPVSPVGWPERATTTVRAGAGRPTPTTAPDMRAAECLFRKATRNNRAKAKAYPRCSAARRSCHAMRHCGGAVISPPLTAWLPG